MRRFTITLITPYYGEGSWGKSLGGNESSKHGEAYFERLLGSRAEQTPGGAEAAEPVPLAAAELNGRFNSETEGGTPLQAIRRPSQHGRQSPHTSRGSALSNMVRGAAQTQPQTSDKISEAGPPVAFSSS